MIAGTWVRTGSAAPFELAGAVIEARGAGFDRLVVSCENAGDVAEQLLGSLRR